MTIEQLHGDDLEDYYLKSFSIVSGANSIEDLSAIKVSLDFRIEPLSQSFLVNTIIEGMKIEIELALLPKIPDVFIDSENHESYYGTHLKHSYHEVEDICFMGPKTIAGMMTKEVTRNVQYKGVGSLTSDCISLLEWLVVFSQLAQVLIYHHDKLDRKDSNTLWMKSVSAEMTMPFLYTKSIPLIGEMSNFKQLKRRGQCWNLFEMIGSDVFNTIKFSAKLAHQISEEMTND